MTSDRPDPYIHVDLHALRESDLNARVAFERIDELAASFRTVGVLEPLIVRPIDGDRFEIVVGHRRFRAAKQAGVRTVPAIVRHLSDADALRCQVIENWQRENVHPLEPAETFARWMTLDPSITPQQIAEQIGKSESQVYTLLQFPRHLAPAVREAFRNGEIKDYHARLLLPHTAEVQERAVHAIRTQRLTKQGLREWLKRDESVADEEPLLPFTPEAAASLTDARRQWLARERAVAQIHEHLAAGVDGIDRPVLQLLAAVVDAMPAVPTDVPDHIEQLNDRELAARIVMRMASLDAYRYVEGRASLMEALALACGVPVAEIEAAQFQTLDM